MLGIIFIAGIIVLAIILYGVSANHSDQDGDGLYTYVQETRRVWKRFERNPDSPLGLSNVYEDITVNVLKKDPKGEYYNNGRKVK